MNDKIEVETDIQHEPDASMCFCTPCFQKVRQETHEWIANGITEAESYANSPGVSL